MPLNAYSLPDFLTSRFPDTGPVFRLRLRVSQEFTLHWRQNEQVFGCDQSESVYT
jgi:hypothetical protein